MSKKILKNVKLVQSKNNTIVDNTVIVIEGERIEFVGREKNLTSSQNCCEIVDMKDKYVLPGLWDMHVHLAYKDLKDYQIPTSVAEDTLFAYRRALTFLAHGVTTIRVPGCSDDIDFALRKGIANHEFLGPRIITAGKPCASSGGHGSENGVGADGPYQFRKAARESLWKGADFVKVMVTGGISGKYEPYDAIQTVADEVVEVVKIAHQWKKHVSGHVASSEAAIMCSNAGMDTIEHGYALDQIAVNVMKNNGTVYVPTLIVTDDPTYWQGIGAADWAVAKITKAAKLHHQAVEYALEQQLKICIGTDVPTALMNKKVVTIAEMEALQKMGAKPADLILSATEIPAEVCGLSDEVSKIESGMMADIIACDENPLESVSNLQNISFIMTRGKVIKNRICDSNLLEFCDPLLEK